MTSNGRGPCTVFSLLKIVSLESKLNIKQYHGDTLLMPLIQFF